MKRAVFEEVVKTIAGETWDFFDCLSTLCQKFPEEKAEVLRSILAQQHSKHVKITYSTNTKTHKRNAIVKEYYDGVKSSKEIGVIEDIAVRNRFSSALTGRIILEHYIKSNHESGADSEDTDNKAKQKALISKLMRTPSLIQDLRLAQEIQYSTYADPLYGPNAECIKQGIGHEYEVILKEELRKRNIGFEDEDQFRAKGYDKTPDVKLIVPFSVNGIIINWIESKALFGDDEHHTNYLRDQLWSYWNRFGPGMVIYWFGFIDDLNTRKHKGILVSDSFPESISLMQPKFDWSCVSDLQNLTLENSRLNKENEKPKFEGPPGRAESKSAVKDEAHKELEELYRPNRFEA